MGVWRREKRVRYAVIGLGNIAQTAVLPAFEHASENSELVALVSSNSDKLDELAKRYRVEHTGTYSQFEDVLKRANADAVYIALPNAMHREFTERAARISVHVLCEKPMAMNEEDCEAMIAVCEATGVKLMIAYRLHFEEANLRAIEIARSGEIGESRFFSSVFAQQARAGDIRTRGDLGGGALFDMGIYCINASRYIFRDEPYEVLATQAIAQDERFRGVDEMTTAILKFSGDRVAQITASQGAASVDTFRVVGTEGELRVEPAFTYYGERKHYLTQNNELVETAFGNRDQFAPELVHFSHCILTGAEPEPSGEEGLADVRIMGAIVRSAREGRAVRLGEFRRTRRPDLGLEIRKPPSKKQKVIHAPSPVSK